MPTTTPIGQGTAAEVVYTFFCCGDRGAVKTTSRRRFSAASTLAQPVYGLNQLGGVGIVFVRDASGCLYVNLLVKGGPANLSGVIKQGDVLRFIDGVDIRGKSLADVPSLSGPHGSKVQLGFERGYGAEPFYVPLTRHASSYPDMLSLPPPGYEFPSQGPEPRTRPADSSLIPLQGAGTSSQLRTGGQSINVTADNSVNVTAASPVRGSANLKKATFHASTHNTVPLSAAPARPQSLDINYKPASSYNKKASSGEAYTPYVASPYIKESLPARPASMALSSPTPPRAESAHVARPVSEQVTSPYLTESTPMRGAGGRGGGLKSSLKSAQGGSVPFRAMSEGVGASQSLFELSSVESVQASSVAVRSSVHVTNPATSASVTSHDPLANYGSKAAVGTSQSGRPNSAKSYV